MTNGVLTMSAEASRPSSSAVVHVAHVIDTEGPLHEPIAATFDRLKTIFGIDMPPSPVTLSRLQSGEIGLGGREAAVAKLLSGELLRYNDEWSKIDAMLSDCMSAGFRQRYADSLGKGWVYNWFCMDHVGYIDNPRRRDIGYHHIFDHYREILGADARSPDQVYFHFHPMAFSKAAHHAGNHYFANGDFLYQILSRRIIDRQWFPSVYRPGFDTIRPESNAFLEQFIPFEYSSQSYVGDTDQPDLQGGRWADWRRAPVSWSPYHPDHDDYQRPGNCRRWINRVLNLGTRYRLMTQRDVDLAFVEAAEGKPAIIAYTDHDFRDIRPNVANMHGMLVDAARRFPHVSFSHTDAREAYRSALKLEVPPPVKFNVTWADNRLDIVADRSIFGPQPYLALKTVTGQYGHDNFDIQEPFRSWSYVFDEHNLPLPILDTIGFAACDRTGGVSIALIDVRTREIRSTVL